MSQPKKLTSIIEYNIRYNFQQKLILNDLGKKNKEIHNKIEETRKRIGIEEQDIHYLNRLGLSDNKNIPEFINLSKMRESVRDEIFEILSYYSSLP